MNVFLKDPTIKICCNLCLHLHIQLLRFLLICPVQLCDQDVLSVLRMRVVSPECGRTHTRNMLVRKSRTSSYWKVWKQSFVFPLLRVCCALSMLKRKYLCGISLRFNLSFGCAARGEGSLVCGHFKAAVDGWLAAWLVGWMKIPTGKQTSDLITNPIMWVSYLQCEQRS